MNLPLIIACFIIIITLLIFPLIISYKAEKKNNVDEWQKIKNYGNKINKTRRRK